MAIEDEFQFDETPDSPDAEANDAAKEALLRNYKKALQEEWECTESFHEGTLNPLEIREKTKELLTQSVPKAVAVMLYLAQHSKNESVKLKAASYIIDKSIGKELGDLVGDPLEALLHKINAEQKSDT